ncbi:MAG: PhzF family phenazine biosynthesis protein [Rhizomicrobium sp.]
MKLKLWQVDAFAGALFEGNPAAVVPLDAWLEPRLMQAIAAENNLAETAFFVRRETGRYDLRWFTPRSEVDLCGHATLASAYAVFRFLEPNREALRFDTRSGELFVRRRAGDLIAMALPSAGSKPFQAPAGFAKELATVLAAPQPVELHFCEKGGGGSTSLLALWPSPQDIRALAASPPLESLLLQANAASLIATAPGDEGYDFVSRFFAPQLGMPEDPVTGSAHSVLAPFWARRLDRKTLKARQLSPRGGDLLCEVAGDGRVILEGRCLLYLSGDIEV